MRILSVLSKIFPETFLRSKEQAESLGIEEGSKADVFVKNVADNFSRLEVYAKTLEKDATVLRDANADLAKDAHCLDEIEARYQKSFEQVKNNLKDFDEVTR